MYSFLIDKLIFVVAMSAPLFNNFNKAVHTNYKLIKTNIVKHYTYQYTSTGEHLLALSQVTNLAKPFGLI